MTTAAPADAERFFHECIPITRAMGVRVVAGGEEGLTIEAPVALNYNHLHTAFGGSINAVATLAGYGLLWLELRDCAAHIVIAASSIRFLHPVRETIRALCARPRADALEQFHARLRAKGKARLPLVVRVSENGVACAEFEATFVTINPS